MLIGDRPTHGGARTRARPRLRHRSGRPHARPVGCSAASGVRTGRVRGGGDHRRADHRPAGRPQRAGASRSVAPVVTMSSTSTATAPPCAGPAVIACRAGCGCGRPRRARRSPAPPGSKRSRRRDGASREPARRAGPAAAHDHRPARRAAAGSRASARARASAGPAAAHAAPREQRAERRGEIAPAAFLVREQRRPHRAVVRAGRPDGQAARTQMHRLAGQAGRAQRRPAHGRSRRTHVAAPDRRARPAPGEAACSPGCAAGGGRAAGTTICGRAPGCGRRSPGSAAPAAGASAAAGAPPTRGRPGCCRGVLTPVGLTQVPAGILLPDRSAAETDASDVRRRR